MAQSYLCSQGEVDPTSAEEKQRLKEEAKKLRLQGQNPDEAPDGDFMSEAKVYNSIDIKTRSDQNFQIIICSFLYPHPPPPTFSPTFLTKAVDIVTKGFSTGLTFVLASYLL